MKYLRVARILKAILIVLVVVAGTGVVAQEQTTALPPQPPKRIRVSQGVLDGVVLKRVMPTLPCATTSEHQAGTVIIGVLVDYDGRVKTTSLIDGDPGLGTCAAEAVQQWVFRPYLINDRPLQVESRVVLKFSKKKVEEVPSER